MEEHGSLRENNEKSEKLADRDVITIMIVRLHWILKNIYWLNKTQDFQ